MEPCRKKPKMSHCQFENIIVYPALSFLENAIFDTLSTFSFNFLQELPMWTEWNSERCYEKTPTQKTGYVKRITLSPITTDIVRETMIYSHKKFLQSVGQNIQSLRTTLQLQKYQIRLNEKRIPPLILFL